MITHQDSIASIKSPDAFLRRPLRPPRKRSTPAGAQSRVCLSPFSHASLPTLALTRNCSGATVGTGAPPLLLYLGESPRAATTPAPRSRSRRRRCPRQSSVDTSRRWWVQATKRTANGESAAAGSTAGEMIPRGRGRPPALPETASAPASTIISTLARAMTLLKILESLGKSTKFLSSDVGARSAVPCAATPPRALRAPLGWSG